MNTKEGLKLTWHAAEFFSFQVNVKLFELEPRKISYMFTEEHWEIGKIKLTKCRLKEYVSDVQNM